MRLPDRWQRCLQQVRGRVTMDTQNNPWGPELIVRQDSWQFYGLVWDDHCPVVVEAHYAGAASTQVTDEWGWTEWCPRHAPHIPPCIAPYISAFAAKKRDEDEAFARSFGDDGRGGSHPIPQDIPAEGNGVPDSGSPAQRHGVPMEPGQPGHYGS